MIEKINITGLNNMIDISRVMFDKINEIIDAVNVNNELHEICENINKNNDGFENFLQNGFIKKSDLEKYLKNYTSYSAYLAEDLIEHFKLNK